MIPASIYDRIENLLSERIADVERVGGGCIASTFRVSMKSGKGLIVKIMSSFPRLFLCEANNLRELGKTKTLRVPEVIDAGENYLILEFIEKGEAKKDFYYQFGKKLAKLHRTHGDEFGFHENNYIGASIQLNRPPSKDWAEFYFENRLMYQLRLAEDNGKATAELKERIYALEKRLDEILAGSKEPPTLLHGDLWSGNYLVDDRGEACVFDPATYYGHREADLAMTKLFGGFPSDFYQGYMDEFPLAEGYQKREGIYKLYHVMNHLNLFGYSYYNQAISILKEYT